MPKTALTSYSWTFFGADDETRTRDLILTKAEGHLSYSALRLKTPLMCHHYKCLSALNLCVRTQ